MAVSFALSNLASALSPQQAFNLAWAANWCQFYFNRSPWVEHGYCDPMEQGPGAARLLAPNEPPPAGLWIVEVKDTSDQPGALGYHEDRARISKAGPSGAHSKRGIALHPADGSEVPYAEVFVKTAQEDGVPVGEVLTHELFEALVDPWVMDESKVRKYLNAAAKEFYIAEVGDPVQSEAFALGDKIEGSTPLANCPPECIVSNFAWPKWWGQEQTRDQYDQAGTRRAAFELAPGGYMSVAPESEPEAWSQIYGSDKTKAEATSHAYERAGETAG